jgi:hypothetical protein
MRKRFAAKIDLSIGHGGAFLFRIDGVQGSHVVRVLSQGFDSFPGKARLM